MGGRGSSSIGREKGGGVNPANIVGTRSLVSEREAKPKFVDDVLQVFSDVRDEYGFVVNDIELATIKGKDNNVLAYWDGANIAVNESYFNDRMEKAYQDCIKAGFHPDSGNKTGLQAVAAHELGHALTDAAATKNGWNGINDAAKRIVQEAAKEVKARGVVQFASKISRYATASNAETISEAYADYYCNGTKATRESLAVVRILNKYLK